MKLDIIETKDLTRIYGEVLALDRLDLKVHRGEIFGLIGPDGAGKTTTLRLLATVLSPSSGGGWVAGYDLVKETEQVKKKIGYMPQRFSLYEDLTVDENIEFFARLRRVGGEAFRKRKRDLMEFIGLGPFGSRLAGQLSGGMKQKLGLICTLIHTPELLLLDEPTTGVDPVSRREFWKIITTLLGEGVTVVVSTPYMDEADRCRRIGLIYQGKIIVADTPEAVKAMAPSEKPGLEEAFLYLTREEKQ
ncbi:MAG: ABC transporter ATP-binding protein [Deltaproteobacteria bacterium]|nr:MAG: ABC transporter ATP-binding protein [Deltaproteobacteria bacterium]